MTKTNEVERGRMKRSASIGFSLLLFVVGSTGVSGTTAPTSVAGTVFREGGGIAGLRTGWNRTIILGENGSYSYVTAVSALVATSRPTWRIESPPVDGTYTYNKTGDSTGTLTLSGPGINRLYMGIYAVDPVPDLPVTLRLDFSSTSWPYGDVGNGEYFQGDQRLGYFSLDKLATAARFPMVNVSMRGTVSEGRSLIVGFVIQSDPKDVLIRVVGPSLKKFGVDGEWSDPQFQLFNSLGLPVPNSYAYHDDWSSDPSAMVGIQRLQEKVGAFPLEIGSKDAVGLIRETRGAYTVVCTVPPGSVGGEVLVEVYSVY